MRSTISLPNRIRGLAAERHLTQEALGAILGLSRAAIRRRLQGTTEFTAAELQKLATEFQLPVSSLFGEASHTLAESGDQP